MTEPDAVKLPTSDEVSAGWRPPPASVVADDPVAVDVPAAAVRVSAPPDVKAPKDEWVAYAISNGVPSFEASNATKADLIERVG